MSPIAFEIVVILGLLMINGVFAMAELAVVTARKVRLEQRADGGDRRARAALDLARQPTDFLSTVQVGITLVGVLAGAFGGATLSEQLAARFDHVPWLAAHSEGFALTLVVAGITYLSLVIGELTPKRIALAHPERIASLVARPMMVLASIGRPVVAALTGSSNLVLRLVGIRPSTEPTITEEEVRAVIEQGAEAGVVQEAEQEMVESVFRLGDRRIISIMRPRHDVPWVDVDAPVEAIRDHFAEHGDAPLLVCRESVENVVGTVHAEDLLVRCLSGAPLELRTILRQPLYVPATLPVFHLLERFREKRARIALALDEYGGLLGVVDLDDIVEELVGDVAHHRQPEEPPIIHRDDGSMLVAGALPMEDLEAVLDIDHVDVTARRGFRTVGGLVMSVLGRVPKVGEKLEWQGLALEVAQMDGRRIDKVLVRPRRGSSGEARDQDVQRTPPGIERT
jgi:putative hemolysin